MPTDYTDIEAKQAAPVKEGYEEVQTEKPKMAPVIKKGKAKRQKKGLLERLVVGMLGPDGIPAISSYLTSEIVVPAIKNIIVDSITSGVNMAMFGGEHNRGNHPNYGGPSNQYWNSPKAAHQSGARPTNYANAYNKPAAVANVRHAQQIDDYIIENRNDAILILDNLNEGIQLYNRVSIADYYDMIGVDSSYTDHNYGWNDLSRATIVPSRGGYLIKLPQAKVIS